MFDHAPQGVLVIGASRGLGAALAEEFAERSFHVVGTVRGEARTVHNFTEG